MVKFLAFPDQHTLSRKMWTGMLKSVSPALLEVSTLLALASCPAVSLAALFSRQSMGKRSG
jgi:ABC-type spermidine/putrescine transport system permease subunit II